MCSLQRWYYNQKDQSNAAEGKGLTTLAGDIGRAEHDHVVVTNLKTGQAHDPKPSHPLVGPSYIPTRR